MAEDVGQYVMNSSKGPVHPGYFKCALTGQMVSRGLTSPIDLNKWYREQGFGPQGKHAGVFDAAYKPIAPATAPDPRPGSTPRMKGVPVPAGDRSPAAYPNGRPPTGNNVSPQGLQNAKRQAKRSGDKGK